MDELDRAADALRNAGLVVYPTETVYGLGADALNEAAIERAFDAKGRDRDDPLSLAVPAVDHAHEYVAASERETAFMEAFLPGPVTVVCEKRGLVPDALVGGRDRVGVRVPDNDLALSLLERVSPITATSANVSGRPSVTNPADLDPEIRAAVDVVVAGGTVAGTESTVVDVGRGEIHRRGARADEIEGWLAEHE